MEFDSWSPNLNKMTYNESAKGVEERPTKSWVKGSC